MAAIHLTKDNFKEEVLESKVPVLVDFWAAWCGPCQMVGPVIEEIAGEVTDAKVGKVDVDSEKELAKQYKVMSIPTLIVFKDGEAVKREVGAKPKNEILDMGRGIFKNTPSCVLTYTNFTAVPYAIISAAPCITWLEA